jgi:RNA polymerase sigma factor (sigma-70 family)
VSDVSPFETFCATAHPQLVAALTHHTGDRWLAEELAQEALIRAGDNWARVGKLASPVGWAFRVGANLASSHFRRRRAERRALQRRGVDDGGAYLDADTPDRVAVQQALAGLTQDQRAAVILRYYLGLSTEEAGAALDVSSGAVRGRIHRAVEQLRVALDAVPSDVEVPDVS